MAALALLLFAANPHARLKRDTVRPAPLQPAIFVMVAAHSIPAGTVIAPEDVRPRQESGVAPDGAFRALQDVTGRIAAKSFSTGDLLLRPQLHEPSEVGIAAQVPAGRRAFAIRVAEDEIVGGLLQSGDHVDIFAIIPGSAFPAKNAQDSSDRSQAVLLLQNVPVLAVGENSATRGTIQTGARTVSLSLPPAELARLTLALRFGKVSLAIRKPGDAELVGSATATLDDLIARKTAPSGPAAPPRPAERRVASIPFYSGIHATTARESAAP